MSLVCTSVIPRASLQVGGPNALPPSARKAGALAPGGVSSPTPPVHLGMPAGLREELKAKALEKDRLEGDEGRPGVRGRRGRDKDPDDKWL